MGLIYRLISTFLGIGYTPKGGGTVAAVVCCIAWYFTWRGGNEHFWIQALIIVIITVVGAWTAGKMEAEWGEDSYRIVIDEVAGMSLTLFAVPVRWPYIVIGLALFRFFDISKPLYIRRMERIGGGWGVMLDDMLAGLYANLLLQIVVFINLW
ncbi:MAG TPA: phosphatidylglycerophosphatase A [Puia sp.]|nr:phosphatidylglycerophosphatase A [Puia sp.]